jgi:hypothetical protein
MTGQLVWEEEEKGGGAEARTLAEHQLFYFLSF